MWITLFIFVIILGSVGVCMRTFKEKGKEKSNLADEFEIIEDK